MAETAIINETGAKIIVVDNPTGDELTPEEKERAKEVDRYAKWCDAESPRRFKQKGAKGAEARKVYTPQNVHLAHSNEVRDESGKVIQEGGIRPTLFIKITWTDKDGKSKESGRLYDARQFEKDFEASGD